METYFVSDLSGKEFHISEKVLAITIRSSIFQIILEEKPNFNETKVIALSELNYYREKYLSNFLLQDIEELSALEKTVISSMKDKDSLVDKIEGVIDNNMTIGQRMADNVATFGGSWTFIMFFAGFMFIWIFTNAVFLANRSFDPFPFILLNLILSCLAAIQAPIIMMSQNRQEEKDRDRSKKDYMINLKSELEIRTLHEKIDHLIMHQQRELLEIQKVQIDMMKDIAEQFNLRFPK
jgi:uncharacterized membrane protein